MRSSSVQGFVSTVPTLYEKEEDKMKITLCGMVIGTCAVQFLHYIPLYRNTQNYSTLNCSVKTSLRAGGT